MTTTTIVRVRPVVGLLMGLMAVSLAVMSFLHLNGELRGGAAPYRPSAAGIAEAVIGVVLLAGALVVWRTPSRACWVAVSGIGFAIVGFIVGLTFTVRGGDAIDIAYHATGLPILAGTLALVLLGSRSSGGRP